MQSRQAAILRREIAVDIEEHVRRVGDVDADRARLPRWHDGGIGSDQPVPRIQSGNYRLRLPGGPRRQPAQVSAIGHGSHVQRVRGSGRRNTAGTGRDGKRSRAVRGQRRGPKRSAHAGPGARVRHATRSDRIEFETRRNRGRQPSAAFTTLADRRAQGLEFL